MVKNVIFAFHSVPSKLWFKKIINSIGKVYRFIEYDSLRSIIEKEQKNDNFCHITFDDGDRTFFSNALPTLIKYNIPSTVFLSPKIIIDNNNYWFQDLDYLLLKLESKTIISFIADFLNLDFDFIRNYGVQPVFKCLRFEDIKNLIDRLYKINRLPRTTYQNITLGNLKDIIETSIVQIGAHTNNHPILANENDSVSFSEIKNSIDLLSELTNEKSTGFAYPNGIPGLDYTSREITSLKEIGIKAAFSMNPGHLSKNANLYELPRISCEASYNSALIITKSFFIKFWNGAYNVLKGQGLQSLQRKKIRSYLKSINYY